MPTRNLLRLIIDDCEIEYSDRGSGQPLLLVHAGVFADWFLPIAECAQLSDFRIVRVRRAGYGLHAPLRHLTIQDHANHLEALARRLGLDAVHVVGHSSGVLIALQLASDHPSLAASLTLLEPAPCGPFQGPAFADLAARSLAPAMEAFDRGDPDAAFHHFMSGVCGDRYRQVIEARLGKDALLQAMKEAAFFFRDEIPAATEWQFTPAQASRIQQPVLIVEGTDGRKEGPLSQEVTGLAAKLLPHARISYIDGANHMLPLQRPDTVAQVIADFARHHPILAPTVS